MPQQNKEEIFVKKYETPEVEITPIYNSVFTESSGDGPIDLPKDEF